MTSSFESQVEVECAGCDEEFSVRIGSFTSSLLESASVGNTTSLETEVADSTAGGSVRRTISVSALPKPYAIGVGEVALVASHRGRDYTVGSAVFTIQGDSSTYPSGIFVSRSGGSDALSQPGSASAPLATVSEAFNRALTQLYSASGPAKNISIVVGDGVHLVDATINVQQNRIRSGDSLTILPWDNAKPTLFMGREIPGDTWSKDDQGLWRSCHLGSATASDNYLSATLYRNLEPLAPARFPNSGMLTTLPVYESDGTTRKVDQFRFNEGGLANLPAGTPIQVTFVDQYITYKSQASVTGSTVTITNPAYYGKFYQRENERHEFYIEGPKALIDGQVVSAAGDSAYEFAQENGCVFHNHAEFNPSSETVRYALPTHSGLIRIFQGTASSGALRIYGIQLAGGALARHAGNSGPNWGNPETNHALVILEAASNVEIADSHLGPSGMAGVIGYRDVVNFALRSNLFEHISGPAVSVIGRDFRPTASVQSVMIEDNAFVHPNPAILMSRGVSLGNVGNTIVRNNYFRDLYQAPISVSGLRYYYLGLTWCQRVECPRVLGKGTCSPTEQARMCECDPDDPVNGATCLNTGSNVRTLSWEDAQEYNPTRNILVQGNFIEDGLATVNDAGLIYIWGIPYGDSNTSDSCAEDPVACKLTTNVSVVENVTLNSRELRGENHLVHYYGDDGANSTDFRRNVAINPKGSAILLFAKGQGGIVQDNLLIGSDRSAHAMLNFAEFSATSRPEAAPFLSINRELNRKKTLSGNAFVQVASGGVAPSGERGSLMFFSNWDPPTDDGYGPVLQSSSQNLFVETTYGQSSRKSVFLRMPTPQLLLTIPQWQAYRFSGGRSFDADSTILSVNPPTTTELLEGVLPRGDGLTGIKSKLPHRAGVTRVLSRYQAARALVRMSIELQK